METKVYNFIKIENCDVYITENGALESTLSIGQVDQLSLGKGCTLNHLPAHEKIHERRTATQTAGATATTVTDGQGTTVKKETSTQGTEHPSRTEESMTRMKSTVMAAACLKMAVATTGVCPPIAIAALPLVAYTFLKQDKLMKKWLR